jgi:hypothetical protein
MELNMVYILLIVQLAAYEKYMKLVGTKTRRKSA